jgi:hypothetical protein
MSAASDEDRELRAWRAAYREIQRPGTDACPADDELAGLATGETAGEERLALADHVAGCRRCSESLRDLLELDREASRRADPAAGLARPGARRALAWAASVLLVSALAIVVGRSRPPSDDRLRSSGVEAPVSPAPGSELAGAPDAFVWPPGEGAARVRLFDARGELVWERSAEVPGRARLPREIGERLRAGESYFWVIEGAVPGARRLGPYWFRLDGP